MSASTGNWLENWWSGFLSRFNNTMGGNLPNAKAGTAPNPGAMSGTTSSGTPQPVSMGGLQTAVNNGVSGVENTFETWYVSIIVGAVGLVLIIVGLIMLFQSSKTVQGVVKSTKSIAAVAA